MNSEKKLAKQKKSSYNTSGIINNAKNTVSFIYLLLSILFMFFIIYTLYISSTSNNSPYGHPEYNEEIKLNDNVQKKLLEYSYSKQKSDINYKKNKRKKRRIKNNTIDNGIYENYGEKFTDMNFMNNLTLKPSTSTNIKQNKKSTNNSYDKLKSIYYTPEFLGKYLYAIMAGYKYKLDIYMERYKNISEEYMNNIKKSGNSLSAIIGHDIEKTRLKRQCEEYKDIIEALNTKIKNLNISTLFIDLKDMMDNGFKKLIGREDVKDFLALTILTYSVNPLVFLKNFQNILIYGKSGVGKTKLAETIGYVYSKCGILIRGKLNIVTKTDLTSQYINESSYRTQNKMLGALEGILFIDEAYSLSSKNNLFGKIDSSDDVITEIVARTDKDIGLSIIIAAGYEKQMEEQFVASNSGIPRRFPHKIILENYNSKTLTKILVNFITENDENLFISDEDITTMYKFIEYLNKYNPNVLDKQAGDMQKLSSIILKIIYSNTEYTWKKYSTLNNSKIILNSFNEYLKPYKVIISYN